MNKIIFPISLALIFAAVVTASAQEGSEKDTPTKDQMVSPEKAGDKKIILPDDKASPLSVEEIEPVKKDDYWAYLIPGLKKADGYMDKISDVIPFEFGGKLEVLSAYIDEGFNDAPHHLSLQETYWGSYGGFTFKYWQEDFFHKRPKIRWDNDREEMVTSTYPHTTMERDFTFSYQFTILKRLSMEPFWMYENYPGFSDTQRLGCHVKLDIPLHPAMLWKWNYVRGHHDGMYYEFSLSQPFDISPGGRKLCTFTPCISMGMNQRNGIPDTIVTHINYGMQWEFPLGDHLSVFAYLNFLQGLNNKYGYVDESPWGGMGVQMKF